jgi:thiamine monophosphate kinase
MFELSWKLANSGFCTSCIDNTDGFAQSLQEISNSSRVGIIIDSEIEIPEIVHYLAMATRVPAIELALGPGADFSLIGTISPNADIASLFGDFQLQRVGYVTEDKGIFIKAGDEINEHTVRGWNYYSR